MWAGCFFAKNNTIREEEMGNGVQEKVRAVAREAGRPARIVLCETDWERLRRKIGGEVELRRMEKEECEYIAAVHAYGREIGMESWVDADGQRWFGPAIVFGCRKGEMAGLNADEAEKWRRFLGDGEGGADECRL